jgi:hypothetical protein
MAPDGGLPQTAGNGNGSRSSRGGAAQMSEAVRSKQRKVDQLDTLKGQLVIYLYRYPIENSLRIMEVIENAETIGELQLLQEYILARQQKQRQAAPQQPRAEIAQGRSAHGVPQACA